MSLDVPRRNSVTDELRELLGVLLDAPTTAAHRALHACCVEYLQQLGSSPRAAMDTDLQAKAAAVERSYSDLLQEQPGTTGYHDALQALRHAVLQAARSQHAAN